MKWYASHRFARRFDRFRQYDIGREAVVERIGRLREIRGADVVELGAGTGFLTIEFARRAKHVTAFDRSPFMMGQARRKLRRLRVDNCDLKLADHRALPLPDDCADLVVAAWTLAAVVYDVPIDSWRAELDRVVTEMRRLVRPGGLIAILCPADPGPRDYPRRLRLRHGFRCTPFESRWRFPSRSTARKVIQFFFNETVWKACRSRMPGDFVTQGGLWWRKAGTERERCRSGRCWSLA